MTLLLAGIAALPLLELAVTVLMRPQSGPFALAAIFEPHLLALGAVCGLLAILATLSDSTRVSATSSSRCSARRSTAWSVPVW